MDSSNISKKALDITDQLISSALKSGADAADSVVFESVSLDATYRLGKLEEVERSESTDLGLRVFIGKKQAFVSSTDFSPQSLDPLVERAVAMVKEAPEDPYCGLAQGDLLAKDFPELDLVDPTEPTTEELQEIAATAEESALAVSGITNSEGASASWSRGGVVLATSEGFRGSSHSTSFSLSCAVLAGQGMNMEMNYDFHSALHREDLKDAAEIGRTAAERALRALNARQVSSQAVPVVYENRLSNSLLRHFAGAILGTGIARNTSFLIDKLGKAVFAENIDIIDDPHRPRGLASEPFDGEGVANQKTTIVENGVLKTWLLDTATARQLDLTTTGHAMRGTGGPPSPGWSNLYMKPGDQTPEALIGDIDQGLFVNSMFGPSINATTGDYSVGVSGLWIDKGELTYPVNEITIAGNLIDMFRHITPANDLSFRYGTNAPTLRVEGMMVAGA